MDKGTEQDYLQDLMAERDALLRQIQGLNRQLKTWRGIAHKTWTFHIGCLPGCRQYLLCTCGYEHYRAELTNEMVQANRND